MERSEMRCCRGSGFGIEDSRLAAGAWSADQNLETAGLICMVWGQGIVTDEKFEALRGFVLKL
jgi:hypothetical protein